MSKTIIEIKRIEAPVLLSAQAMLGKLQSKHWRKFIDNLKALQGLIAENSEMYEKLKAISTEAELIDREKELAGEIVSIEVHQISIDELGELQLSATDLMPLIDKIIV